MANFSANTQIHRRSLIQTGFFFLTIFLYFTGFAQTALSSTNKKALKSYEKGQTKAKEREFESAIAFFNSALKHDPQFYEAFLRKGSLFNAMGMEDSVYANFSSYLKIKATPSAAILNRMAFMAFERGHYEKSLVWLEAYLLQKPEFREVEEIMLLLNSIDFAQNEIIKGDSLEISLLPREINNEHALQYMPAITIDNSMLVFTRRNTMNTPTDFDAYRDEDIMVAYYKKGKWLMSESISPKINTPLNEGAATISSDGNTMIFSSCDRRDSFGSCDLYLSRRTNTGWSKPRNLGKTLNSKYWEAQPSLSADGKTLYFSSNRPGGIGRRDLWVSSMEEDGNWTSPVNLGKTINSKQDETTPFIHPNGETLYYSSNGFVGLGNYDMYVAEKQDSAWSSPRNLGYPINTHNDEAALLLAGNGKTAFYAKEIWRDGEIVKSDIATFEMPIENRARPATYIVGNVIDNNTRNPIRTQIEVIDLNRNQVLFSAFSDSITGAYTMVLPSDKELACYVKKKGYLYYESSFFTESNSITRPDTIDIALRPIAVDEYLVLKNIYFDVDSYKLDKKSRSELENILQVLKENPSIVVEISGHTDDSGTTVYNQTLSENRAKEVYIEILKEGIPKSRLLYKGFGSKKPIVSNDTEKGRESNRRIEFRVLRITQ
ncbi:MAG: OmpA family protein [Cyclobacteriaceae bacterium]